MQEMKTHLPYWGIPLVLAGFLTFSGPAVDEAHARKHHDRAVRGERVYVSPPAGYRTVYVGKSRYYQHRGDFYRKGPRGYYRTRAPYGAVIVHLPPGHRRVMHGRNVYYTYRGDYYRRAPSGYIAIRAPF